MIVLSFDRGSIVAEGGPIPLRTQDSDEAAHRVPALRYRDILEQLRKSGTPYEDEAMKAPTCPRLGSEIQLRNYQKKALKAWEEAGKRGIIVLPTGAGKTVIALKAMEELSVSALVVVPTLVLVDQWRREIEGAFGVEAGVLGGGSERIRAITVSTYDSASLRADSLGNRFELIVFDEVHHLPAQSYRRIGLHYLAPYRLGLTATLSGDEEARLALGELVGETVYELGVDDLAGVHLSDYTVITVPVPLTPEEKADYEKQFGIYRDFLRRRDIRIRSAEDYTRFVMRSGRDPEARRAMLARNRAMDLALNSTSKVHHLMNLLKRNPEDKTLIFTRHNSLVYRISREMLIPAITHQTPKEEREQILRGFRAGRYRRIVTSQVLDEGVDVPDASMAVILSGTGSSREFIQRLGRVLRKREGKEAKLVELVSQDTAETRLSKRRKGG